MWLCVLIRRLTAVVGVSPIKLIRPHKTVSSISQLVATTGLKQVFAVFSLTTKFSTYYVSLVYHD